MRRNLFGWLLFALALTLQAPPVASYPHSSDQMCSQADESSIDGSRRAPAPSHRDCDLCLLCQAAWPNIAVFGARPASDGLLAPARWIVLVWTLAKHASPATRHEQANQARAPPLDS